MSIRNILILSTTLILGACGGGGKPPANPDTSSNPPGGEEPKSDMPEEGKTAEKGEGATKSEEKAEPATAPKIDKPPSESTIAGKSVSEIDGATVASEAKKLGWVKEAAPAGANTSGSYETLKLDIEKGKSKGFIEIIRPAANPGAPGSGGAPSEVKAAREKDGAAVHYDEASDVLIVVMVEGKTADAKKLLAQFVKAAKKTAKTAEKTEKAAEKTEKKAAATPEKKAPAPAPSK
jgi:hypothetical protein